MIDYCLLTAWLTTFVAIVCLSGEESAPNGLSLFYSAVMGGAPFFSSSASIPAIGFNRNCSALRPFTLQSPILSDLVFGAFLLIVRASGADV